MSGASTRGEDGEATTVGGDVAPETARPKPALALLMVVAVLGLGLALGWHSTWTQEARLPANQVASDFEILFAAGEGLAHGLDIHDPEVLDELGRRLGRASTPFCAYNPLVVRFFGWFGQLHQGDFHAAFTSWWRMQWLLLGISLVLLAKVLRRAGLPLAWAATAASVLLLFNDGTWTNLYWNQMNLVALAAMLGALLAAMGRRPLLEGVLLAAAVCAKTSPLLLVVVALAMGRRRTLLAAALTGLALFELSVLWSGWDVHHSYVESVLPMLRYAPDLPAGMAFANNMSATNLAPHGLISRSLFRAGDMSGLLAATWSVSAVALGLLATGLLRSGRRDVLGQYGLGLATMFLVSSVTWPHHLVWLAIPLAALAAAAWGGGQGGGRAWRTAGALVVSVLLFLPMYSLTAGEGTGAHIGDVTHWQEETDVRWRSGALAALLALLVLRPRSGERSLS